MNIFERTIWSVAHGMLASVLASGSASFADEVKIDLKVGEIAIVIPASGTYPAAGYPDIEVYAVKTKILDCVLCKDNVDSCRKYANKYCLGSVDVVFQSVLSLSVVDTRDKHSPDTCYRQVCWSGGACKAVPYPC